MEQVQAIVRIANQYKVPLWPISRGKNFGYGGAAPVLKGSVVLDLSRMKKIELDEENGTVLLEPGVGFFDLYDYIQARKLPYWLSVPGNSWGSVAGNALDRGVGYTPYGDHCMQICGLEVVMPTGEIVRTGMGAMGGAPTWQLYRNGYGPGWDQMFVQSNFGIVTKLGLWLMPEPESLLGIDFEFDKPEDLGWAIDTLMPLRREGIIRQSPSMGNWLRSASVMTTRDQWTKDRGPLDENVVTAIRKTLQHRVVERAGALLRPARDRRGVTPYSAEGLQRQAGARDETHTVGEGRRARGLTVQWRAAQFSAGECELARRARRSHRLLAGAAAQGQPRAGSVPSHLRALSEIRHGLPCQLRHG